MATNGTLNTNAYEGRYLQFSWTATQDVLNNKSTVSWTLKGAGVGSVGYYNAGNFGLVIDGATVYSTGKWDRIRLYNGTVLASGTKTYNHKSDGTCTFSVGIRAGIYTYDVNCTASTTFTLTTIPRASAITVSDSSPDMGESLTFNITRASTAFTHKLTYTWNGVTSDIATDVATSATWTAPVSFANNIPNSTSGECVITCITYNGSTEIGRKQIPITLNVPSSIKPSISGVTISEAETGLAGKFGAYIQNKSRLKVVTTASGAYSSTIKTYEVKILGKTYTGGTITSDILTVSGSLTVSVTVTDTRGRTVSTSEIVSVLAYKDPRITAFTVKRCNSDGTLNDEGEYVKLDFAFNVSSLNSKNDKTYTIAYKLKTDSAYTTLVSGNVYSADTTIISNATFSGDNPYDFKLTVSDYFKSVSLVDDIPTAFTLMDFHSSGTGMAIGKVAENADLLEIALASQFNKPVAFRGNRYVYQPPTNNDKGYILLATITLTVRNVDAPIVFVINRRGALCPMTVYARFASSIYTSDPDLESLTYEGDDYGAYLVKADTSIWKLYVDNTVDLYNPCLQEWYTTDNQRSRLSVTFADEQISNLPSTFYRATPAKMPSLVDTIYPVGSIYLAYNHTSPAELFGGTWTRLENAFLWASTATDTIGGTGGEKTHKLTVDEMPKHSHDMPFSGASAGAQSPYMYYVKSASTNNDAGGRGWRNNMGTFEIGGGLEHNNMPPYIQVSAWRRTA